MKKIKIAVQKSGRLSDNSLKLLKDCGIKLPNGIAKLITEASNFPIELLFLRDDDIPQYVEQGIADIGILGLNVVLEKSRNVDILEKLGFAKCRLSLAIPKAASYDGLKFFEGKRIATSYPKILQGFLDNHNIDATIEEISGSVEISPGIGLADSICDIVSTGSTLFTNSLKEVAEVISSEAVIIANKNLDSSKTELLNRLLLRINAVKSASENKYILMNAPDSSITDISKILPGMKSPTILPLAKEGWSSLHSVVKEDEFWEIIEKIKSLGAQGILVVPIEKMII